jgi:hypothetical protein
MFKKTFWVLAALGMVATALAAASASVSAQESKTDAEAIMKEAHLNLYYAGDDGRSVVHMTLTDKRGKTRTRDFTMIRLDVEEGGAQKYYAYFLEPSDVRRTSFMVWKEPEKDDSRWIYVPAIDLVRRISSKDKGSSFVGSDFSYEDVSGRHWTDDVHTLLREEDRDGTQTYVIESVPKEKDAFAKKVTWISIADKLPVREEYFDKKGELFRVFTADEMKEMDGILTITKRTMTNIKKNHSTTVEFTDIAYDLGIEDGFFTERYLKAPPKVVMATN